MAHFRSYSHCLGSHRRQYWSMGRHAYLASQDEAQEIQVGYPYNHYLADSFSNLSAPLNITMTSRRIQEEKWLVEQMIHLYCRQQEGHTQLCPNCRKLLVYAHYRLDKCHYGGKKPTCKKCPTHCYQPEMKEKIKKVMRWAGPRMILHHPLATVKHLLREMVVRAVEYKTVKRMLSWKKVENGTD